MKDGFLYKCVAVLICGCDAAAVGFLCNIFGFRGPLDFADRFVCILPIPAALDLCKHFGSLCSNAAFRTTVFGTRKGRSTFRSTSSGNSTVPVCRKRTSISNNVLMRAW